MIVAAEPFLIFDRGLNVAEELFHGFIDLSLIDPGQELIIWLILEWAGVGKDVFPTIMRRLLDDLSAALVHFSGRQLLIREPAILVIPLFIHLKAIPLIDGIRTSHDEGRFAKNTIRAKHLWIENGRVMGINQELAGDARVDDRNIITSLFAWSLIMIAFDENKRNRQRLQVLFHAAVFCFAVIIAAMISEDDQEIVFIGLGDLAETFNLLILFFIVGISSYEYA